MANAAKPPTVAHRRLNLKALIVLGVILAVGLALYFPIRMLSAGAERRSALEQAQDLEKKGEVDLALRHMARYMAEWPNDLPGLKFQAKLLADSARGAEQTLAAAQANDQALRLDPNGPDSQDVRRRICRLYIAYADYVRRYVEVVGDQDRDKTESRYLTAESVARQLIKRGADDAEAYRYLALALEGLAVGGNKTLVDQAIQAYRDTLKREPTDNLAADRLAGILAGEFRKDPAAAQKVMDDLLAADPKSVRARMTRYYFFARFGEPEKAQAEMKAASELAPHDLNTQVAAAAEAMQRQDFESARAHLEAIAVNDNADLRVRTLKGMLEWNQRHPDEAIEEWRKGLVSVAGSDQELTWQLAYTLIQLGRLTEARPLVAQFQRLAGENNEAMGRFLRALFELRSGRPANAIRDLDRAASRISKSRQPEVYLALGRAQEALGNEGEAMSAYQKSASLAPTAAEPRRAVARILAKKSPSDAQNEMEQALARNPKDLSLLVEVGRIRLRQQAQLPEDQRRFERVDELVDRAVAIDPNNFAVQTLQADVLAASGRLDRALDLLAKSVAGPGKGKPEIWLTYAGALDRLNRREEALKALETASSPDAAGDHAILRIGRAKLLTRLGRAQAARSILSDNRDAIPRAERPDLAHALAELCRELGDFPAARAALLDWGNLLPDSAEPGLALLAFAQAQDDDEAARAGLESLRHLGGDQEPYGLAARILELLRVERGRTEGRDLVVAKSPEEIKRLDEADRLVAQLNTEAPQLPVTPMLQGMIRERRGDLDGAIEAYRRSAKDAAMSPAVARLVELLARRDRFDEIAQLKARFEAKASADGTPSLVTNFDQILMAVSLKLGDNKGAEQAIAEMARSQPTNLTLRVNQARLLANMGKSREAEDAIRQIARLRPTEPGPWLALLAFRLQHTDLGEPEKLLDEIKAGYKGPHPELLTARCRWALGDVAGADKLYQAALAKNGDDLVTIREAIEFDDGNGRTEQAEAKLRRVLKIDPKATWAGRMLALILSARPDRSGWAEAWSLVRPGAPTAGNDADDRLARALVQARSAEAKERAEAVTSLQALAADLPVSNPLGIRARVQLAQSYLVNDAFSEAARLIVPVADDGERTNTLALALAIEAETGQGDSAAAARHLDRLVTLEPNTAQVVISRAFVLMAQGKPEEAYQVVEAAFNEVEKDPKTGEGVALALQNALDKRGNKAGALKLAERIASRWPQDAYIPARLQLAAGKAADALKSCRVALDAGSVVEAMRLAGAVAMSRRNDPATVQVVDEIAAVAQEKAPKSPDVLISVALVRHLQERYDDEVGLYKSALETKPPGLAFLNNMAWTLAEGLQHYDEALERIDEAIRREGRQAEFLDTRGVILFRLDRLDEAIKDFEESARVQPDGTTFFHLARAYKKANQKDKAREARDKAKKAKLDINTLDPTDKADFSDVMNGN